MGGYIENLPKGFFILEMIQINESCAILLYFRDGSSYDWANSIIRIDLSGNLGEDYPISYI